MSSPRNALPCVRNRFNAIPFLLGIACCLLTWPGNAAGQLPLPQLETVFPPGGQQGSEFEVNVVDGSDLDELSSLIFNHPGIQQVSENDPLSNPRQFRIRISPDVLPGYYAVRTQGRFGVSNARMFHVDSMPVQTEGAITDRVAKLDHAIYGTVSATREVDRYELPLQAGQTLGVQLDALSLDSPLRPVIEVIAPSGKRAGFARRMEDQDPRLNLVAEEAGTYEIRVHDQLFQGGKQYTYRMALSGQAVPLDLSPAAGPADRLPPALAWRDEGSSENAEELTVAPRTKGPVSLPGFLSPRRSHADVICIASKAGDETLVAAAPRAGVPSTREVEPNDAAAEQTASTLPLHVQGRFQSAYDVDHYAVTVKKGERISLEVFAERDGSQLDPVVTVTQQITDQAGKTTNKAIKVDEDIKANLLPSIFDTLSDDASLLWTADADCQLQIAIQNRYATPPHLARQSYRLLVKQANPHFAAVALALPYPVGNRTADTPAGCVLRKAGTAQLTVLLHRHEGFTGGVSIQAERTPPGVTVPPVVIPPGHSQATVVLHAAPDAAMGMADLTLQVFDTSQPDSSPQVVQVATVVRKGDQIYPAVSRLGHSLIVSVIDETLPGQVSVIDTPAVLHVCPTQTIAIPLGIARDKGFAEKIDVTVAGLDKKSKIQAVNASSQGEDSRQAAVLLKLPADAPAGWYTCQLDLATKISYARNPQAIARAEQELQRRRTNKTDLEKKRSELQQAIKQTGQKTAELKQQENPPELAALAETAKTQAAELKSLDDQIKKATTDEQNQQKAIANLKKTLAAKPVAHASALKSLAIRVHAAPLTLSVEPKTLAVTAGETASLKARLQRKDNFAGPVRLRLIALPGQPELAVEPVMLPVGKDEVELQIPVPGDAAKGKRDGYLLRAEFNNEDQQLGVDAPLTIEVR